MTPNFYNLSAFDVIEAEGAWGHVMAIYSLNLGFISRSEGRSAVGFSAYMGAARQQDLRTGVTYNYDCKDDVIVSRVLVPEKAPDWTKTPCILWNKVEQFEDDVASLRFRGDPHNPDKNQKSLRAKEKFLASSQTAQTIMGALPIEFSKMEAEKCVEEFLLRRFVSRGLVVEYAIHWDKGNPHFHGMITRRPLIEGEFSQRKDRDIVTKAELLVTRKQWEEVANKHLEVGGHEVRIDSRSHADRGLLFLPLVHEGWYAQRLAERGQYSRIVSDNEAIRQSNIEILCHNPATLVQELAQKRTVFTRAHLQDEILRRVGGDEKLFALLKAKVEDFEIPKEMILNQANDNFMGEALFGKELQGVASRFADQLLEDQGEVHFIGENLNRDKVFTSLSYKRQEEKLIQLADTLHKRNNKFIRDEIIAKSIENREAELGFELSEEQKAAITHLCSGPDICILNGKAGTGKTTLLKAVSDAYQESGYRVLGTSFQGKAVEIMEQDIGIQCKTLDSFLYSWKAYDEQKALLESGKLWGKAYGYVQTRLKELEHYKFTDKDIIIVDEANMVGGHLWEPFLEEVTSKGAKVLIVQDPAQIKSRDPGDYGRLFGERFGFCETSQVVRQRVSWQKESSKLLNDHHVLDGLKPYYEKGHFTWFDRSELVIQSLTQAYVKDYIENPTQSRMTLAYRNAEVYELNQSIRKELQQWGYLGQGPSSPDFSIDGETYTIGDRIRFTQNDNHGVYVKNIDNANSSGKGVKNGTFGMIEAYDENQSLLKVKLEGNRHVQFNTNDYAHITHGYAMGIHKSEGSTFDRSFVSLDPLLDPSTLLVAMTRHRENVQVYINREQFRDFKDVVDQLSRPAQKATIHDYTVSEDQKPYFQRVQHYRDLAIEGATLREEMESSPREDSRAGLDLSAPLYKHASYKAYQACFEEKKQVATDILNDWQNHAPYVKLAGIRKDVLEVEVGLRPRLLSDLEHRASIQVQGYMDRLRETRDLWKTISQTHPGVLAPSHELYESYKTKKTERDSLAYIFQENRPLYGQFFRVTKDKTGRMTDYWGETVTSVTRVYQASLTHHAEAHLSSQQQALFYERLSSDQKSYYDEVKSYVNARNEAAALYGYLRKEKETSKAMTSLDITSKVNVSNEPSDPVSSPFKNVITMEQFHKIQATRDALALKLVDSPQDYQPFFKTLNIKEDKLLDHAISGELRQKVQTYSHETDVGKRASKAQELKRILSHAKDYRILKESGLEAGRLSFDIAFYEKVKEGEISPVLSPDQIYKPIQSYLNAEREAARLWKSLKTKEKETSANEKSSQEQQEHQKDWKRAQLARKEQAHALVNDKVALAVVSAMDQALQDRLLKQAGMLPQKTEHMPSKKPHRPLQAPSNEPSQKASLMPSQASQLYPSATQVLEASRGDLESLATELLGPQNVHLSNKASLRFGSKGSLVFNLSGPKAGLWKDFESGEAGNFFQLIQREKNLNFKDSLNYLANRLNMVPITLQATPLKETLVKEPTTLMAGELSKPTALQAPAAPQKQASLEEIKERAARLNAVSELHMKSKPLEGTIAELYLRQTRGIKGPLADDLRYLPKGTTFMYQGEQKALVYPCFAAFGRTHNERLSSVQLTKLDDTGKRALDSNGQKLNKLLYGIAKGSFVCVQQDKQNTRVFIAEGVETALSLKEAGISGKIIASQGIHNMANYQGQEKQIILCGDNDDHKENSKTHSLIKSFQEELIAQGKDVSVIKPNESGEDFNDVLKKRGIKGVQAYVQPYLNPHAAKEVQVSVSSASKAETQKVPENKKAPEAPETQKIAQSIKITSSSGEKTNNLTIMAKYIEDKIREIKAYEGTSLAREAKQELRSYLEIFQKDKQMLRDFRDQCPELIKDIQNLYQKQHNQEKTHQKSYGIDM